MKIIIIEDEKITAKDLSQTILAVEPTAEILTILSSVEEATDYLLSHRTADLIFSDIELGDGLSFEVFESINNKIPVIFCTAYNEYALKAFDTVGIDYLLKPFTEETVRHAIGKYNTIKASFSFPGIDFSLLVQKLQQQLEPTTKLPSVIVQNGDKIIPLEGDTIAMFYIEDDYVFAHTFAGKRHLLSHKLDKLEQLFSPAFYRANRQFLVNRNAVRDASHYFNRKLLVNLTFEFPVKIIVGKVKATSFIDWLAQN